MLIETKADPEHPVPARAQRRSGQHWHAVSITGPSSACAAAQACKGKRYLSGEAPRLPLEGCDAARCECRYRHFADRRGDPRREDETAAKQQAGKGNDRRTSRGRRATD